MREPLEEKIIDAVRASAGNYYRLVLLVGPPQSGKTRVLEKLALAQGWPRLNVNLTLSEKLLELTQKQRAVHAARILGELVERAGQETVILDNIELLFSQELAQDPLRLLQGLARNRAVVAAWPGTCDGDQLTYAEPSHVEHRRYSRPEATFLLTDPVESHPTSAPGASASEDL
jgi:hypothetical protein